MCDIHAVGKMAGKLSAERDTFMKEKEEYLESIQSKLRKLLFEEIALEDGKRQIMRQSLNSTPPVMGGAASGIRPEDYLTMA